MSRSLPPLVRDILHALLDQAEQPERSQVARVRLNERRYPAYYAEHSAAPRRETNAALHELARQEVVRLGWRRWEEGNWLETVDLNPTHTATAYTLLGRTPRNTREEALRLLLASQPRLAGWHARFMSWAEARLAAHRTVAPLDLSQPSWNDDMLRLLAAVAALQVPTLERTLSVRLFGDSKRAETLRRALLTVLRRHEPEAAAYADDDWALLRAHQLDRVPEYIPIAGPLVLQLHDVHLDTAPFVPSIALSAATIDQMTAARCSARALVTIENATSFSEFTVARAADVTVLYTGGFASPSMITLLRRIRAARPTLPFWHWGDIDAGGLRILAHLRRHIEGIQPLGMDITTLDSQHVHGQPLTGNDRVTLASLRDAPTLIDRTELLEHMLAVGFKVEQEAVSARDVAARLDRILARC